ncbi:MAG: Asp-tRNA(Asn)/Glu-tRNA(Gln) amidotransferase GatCAB subunit C [Pseudomonadales bacterium]|jgi:aspartyl-tRNA(Asn)/glutamyl-tRNA(Gln) amidotransferase subunit C|uniref:Asp-tRNA(Asn)/Glu-tRNA(Gln) amidotransferase subunit GatC n=1 Tax=unclassified Ketobacter TaxID=2639109 RepID=UPI000C3A901D|nr:MULTISPECIES: Asp-tRNA(Asn)/Glu-tRNA(Gln) amidotransferase subunit GatC [unclassified Ketobacter]MAA60138.1 Asp-tRNA(Asn)/Glu-tRNA(Gln) amidotransferase GatCAB subunit C [Pseudomonadales bacterium]MEC8811132.1 Asp-tRNA(Asn)/Glu-tRNA(Gln) amidotransferase subunit GatC [Pseudomonadota bacterium]TNC88636.1 MAG: Asp-tRNA(Asn)/Glu-tRNA(Gln) amidotransferase GatCAB subunit C [Alcanivorax sp.]HAG92698.1 Asp-tRNA(Asn)/Glu-tRNA(Gln) amidotransferase GatCAB subunit C [Gammaproteobacteria bacterium]MA|tara:strand:+ start:754 stop:1041 length:288 start_codon:yes stop_codon:yes gene_type:complete
MALDKEDVVKIAHLARLQVADSEIDATTERLSSILGMIEQLQAAPTDGIEPMAHPTDAVQRLREDVVTESNHRDQYQSIAPATEDGLYLVPQVIE